MRTNRNNTMYCPEEKALQMSRTLLAANRRAARSARKNKRNWHGKRRAARRNIDHRFEGVSVNNALDMVDDYEEATQPRTESTFAKVESQRKWDVFDRREGDRLGLYFRWAEKVTDHLNTAEERMEYIRRNTPLDDFMIDHSLMHLQWSVAAFRSDEYYIFSDEYYERNLIARKKRDTKRNHVHEMVKTALMRVIEYNKHSEFNNLVGKMQRVVYKHDWKNNTKTAVFLSVIRPFEGLHDIEEYADEVMRISFRWRYWPYEERVLRALEQCGKIEVYEKSAR